MLIVGAGAAGRELARALRRESRQTEVVGFIDDRFTRRHARVAGLRALGPIAELAAIAARERVDQAYIAIPSAEGELVRRIIAACHDAEIAFRIVPRVLELVEGHVKLDALREVRPEDLLGRAIAKADQRVLRPFFRGKRVLVTGAAGSIGSELCRQIAQYRPAQLVAVDWWENGLFELDQELRMQDPSLNLDAVIASVQDGAKIASILRDVRPHVVFHAAAYKHVPLMERFPEAALLNNIVGTWNVALAAQRVGVAKFVLISTDKAVNPTSVMGASKAVAELLVQSLNGRGARYSCVRFGNVLASSGSVIPTFQKQIRRGGPVTLTHPDMVRYFMTIPEAVQLILQAGYLSAGGEIFVLDMGEPVKILDLARNLIRLSGFVPERDIEIAYTGIRPGEKLHEETLTAQEGLRATKRASIFISTKQIGGRLNSAAIVREVQQLARRASAPRIRRFLERLVPTYRRPSP